GQIELQRRWGILSCQRTQLPRVESELAKAEAANSPVRQIDQTVQLGSLRFELRLSDEQAKVNLNRLVTQISRSQAEQMLQESIVDFRLHMPLLVRLPRFFSTTQPSIEHVEQILEAPAGHPVIDPTDERLIATRFTCWGDGKLNIRRAD